MFGKSAAVAAAGVLAASCGSGADGGQDHPTRAENGQAAVPRPANLPNEAWITLHGRVAHASPALFELDFGSGRITVEMDDWDWYMEGQALRPGDEVSVTGRIDRDEHAGRTLEAAAVFVKSRGVYYHASGADEEDLRNGVGSLRGRSIGAAEARGHVVAKRDGEIMLASPHGNVRVDLSRLGDDDLERLEHVRIGERLFVWGDLDPGPRGPLEILADGFVRMVPDRSKGVRQ